jgi:hypothetical protein
LVNRVAWVEELDMRVRFEVGMMALVLAVMTYLLGGCVAAAGVGGDVAGALAEIWRGQGQDVPGGDDGRGNPGDAAGG